MVTIEITVLVAVIGCLAAVLGVIITRDKRIAEDGEWRGSVSAKLDTIIGIRRDVDDIKDIQHDHAERISAVEQSAKSAHHRIDEMRRED